MKTKLLEVLRFIFFTYVIIFGLMMIVGMGSSEYSGCKQTLPPPDTTPPTTPNNLVANAVSLTQVDLIWDASTDDNGVGYYIYRDDKYIKYVLVTSYTNIGLDPGKEYCYTVRAKDFMGNESAQSNIACATTLPDQSPPSTPTNVSTVFFSPDRIGVTWDASMDNYRVSGYHIYRDSNIINSVNGTSTSDTGQNDFTQYCYKISAYDVSGNESEQSEQSCVLNWDFTTIDSQNALYDTSITTDSADNVHISYTNGLNPGPGVLINNGVKYATNAGGVWIIETVDSAGGNSSIAVDSAGNAHISYKDNGVKYATNASGLWVIVTVDSAGNDPSIAIDSVDDVHISYGVENYPIRELKYATNDSGAWISKTLYTISGLMCRPSIAIDSADNLHICYANGSPSDLKYVTNVSGTWTNETIGINSWHQSIAIDSANNVHVSYAYSLPQYATNASGVWFNEIIDDESNLGFPDVAIDPGDNTHICYYKFYDGYRVKYATKASEAWTIYAIGSAVYVMDSSIAVDSTGTVHICYISDWRNLRYMKTK